MPTILYKDKNLEKKDNKNKFFILILLINNKLCCLFK